MLFRKKWIIIAGLTKSVLSGLHNCLFKKMDNFIRWSFDFDCPIFSCLILYEMMQRPFYERWKMLEKEVIEPRNHERHNIYQSRNPAYRYDLEPFRVRLISHGLWNVFACFCIYYMLRLIANVYRWGERISGCSLLLQSFWRNSSLGYLMMPMVLFFR